MRIDVLTLFPEMFAGVLGSSILRRAAEDVPDPAAPDDAARVRKAVASYHVHNIREWSADTKHRRVDSPPYGGGPGMVMQCQPIWDAVQAVTAMDAAPPLRILTTPQGQPLTQSLCEHLATMPRLMILAGHYEGFDQRVLERLHDEPPTTTDGTTPPAGLMEISLGDYVLSGGELPAMTLIDAVVRLLPGALGHAESAHQDSFSAGVDRLLDHPHYTRPAEWDGRAVPDILMSGNHAKIDDWRRQRALEATRQRRPDLLGPEAGGSHSGQAAAFTVVVREALPDDRPAVLDIHRAAFPTDAESRLVDALLDAYDSQFSILAEVDGRPVGHVLVSGMTHEDGGSVRGLLGLAPLAVHPDFQRRGIGSALAREAIRQCKDAAVSRLFVLGEPSYYQRFGFEAASSQGFTSDYDALPGAEGAFQVLNLKPTRDIPPGRVRYAAAFGGFES